MRLIYSIPVLNQHYNMRENAPVNILNLVALDLQSTYILLSAFAHKNPCQTSFLL